MGCELQMICGIIPLPSLRSIDFDLWNEKLVQDRLCRPYHMEPVEMLSRGSNSWSWLEKVLIDLVSPLGSTGPLRSEEGLIVRLCIDHGKLSKTITR